MKKTSLKDKSNSQRTILSSQPSSSDSETFEDYEEDQNIEEEKHSLNGESQISSQEKIRKKSKQIPLKNPTKKLRNQKKPRIVFNVSDTKYEVVRYVAKKLFKWKLSYDPNEEWDLFWTDNSVEPEHLAKMQLFQKINHFPGMYSLARKNHLGRNLMRMRKNFPEDYKFFPPTWLLPAEYSDFKAQFNKKLSKTFILKPEAGCQGRGIFLTRNSENVDPCDHYVAQRYLHKPYLIDGLKFDLRIYVLLAGSDPLRIYLYNDGLGRFATEQYVTPNKENLDDVCMHLTNYAINKDNPNFVFNENAEKDDVGHKRSFISVLQTMKEKGVDVEKLLKEIKDMIVKTFCSVQPILSHNYKSCQPDSFYNNMCFEVLGVDILIDHKLKPWLLEVNHTPSFTTDTPFDRKIKKNVIRDSLVLMNVSIENRIKYKNLKKIELQKRVLTGKKLKLTQEEKNKFIEEAQKERDMYENRNLGNFVKVYPLGTPEEKNYEEFIKYSTKMWEEWTGANIRRNTKKTTIEEKMLKEKGTPNSIISSKKPPFSVDKLLHKQISKVNQHQKQSSQTNIKAFPSENPNFQTQMQSLPNIAQKAIDFKENLSENSAENSKNTLQSTEILLNKALDLKKENEENVENEEKKEEIDEKQGQKINGFRIKTKVFGNKQSPNKLASEEKNEEIVNSLNNLIVISETLESENNKKNTFFTKNRQILRNAENKLTKPFEKPIEKPRKTIQNNFSNSGNYVTPKVMEFAFNKLLRPEEEKGLYTRGKSYVNKQKTMKIAMEFGTFGSNLNMFNVQKHISYFQNPKH